MKKYNHQKIEKHWQGVWEKQKLYKVSDSVKGRENFYTLVEFPYPSGNLHVGHWYAFSVPDIFARYKRMQGQNGLFPIGFDAFGLPAENAALQRGLNPRKWTYSNIAYMRKQLRTMGSSFDWSREVVTCDPEYYRWTQWIFLQFFKKRLAYQAETNVNWCPKDKTVLANEQVINGRCDRCGTEVVQRKMKQWLLKITNYAEKLLAGLKKLDWPEEIKEAQRNWIGKKVGINIAYNIERKANFLLLHGYTGAANKGFFPWLKSELEKAGYQVQTPQLPNPNDPKESEQVEHVFKNCKIDEDTVIVGHSLGGVVAMKVLQRYGKPVKGLVLVAPALEPKFHIVENKIFWKHFSWTDLDYERLRSLAGFRVILSDLTETHRIEYLDFLSKKIEAALIKGIAQTKHFTAKQEPMIFSTLRPQITCFTTRPDTNFGATFVVLGPEHPLLVDNQLQMPQANWEKVQQYQAEVKKKTELERLAEGRKKTGVFTGLYCVNGLNDRKMPIYVSDFVLGHVGTGAVVGVPGHDKRDFEFAQAFNLPVIRVVTKGKNDVGPITSIDQVQEEEGTMVNSEFLNDLDIHGATKKIMDYLEDKGMGKRVVQYRLRDWVISRQRYWGVPIPVIHCKDCGIQQVQEKDLPVKLPEIKDYKPKGDGKSPLAKAEKWVKVKCPNCGEWAERETDTMDTFIDSSWYFLRYTDPKNSKEFASQEKMKQWMPVDRYSGGAEHTTMHLLYSRFWIKAMYDLGLVEWDEPYFKRMNRGIILGPDSRKMSKRWGNVVDPDKYVKELGADTVRMYLAFIGPYNEVGAYPWDPKGIMGVRRFLERVWRFFHQIGSQPHPHFLSDIGEGRGEVTRLLHQTIKKVTEDIESFKFNTSVSALMILLNKLSSAPGGSNSVKREHLEIFLKLLTPFAPHLAEELWQQTCAYHRTSTMIQRGFGSIHKEKWPEYDKKLIEEDTVNIPVQINGKHRATIQLSKGASQEEAQKIVMQDPNVKKHLESQRIRKVIYVPGKIINFVID